MIYGRLVHYVRSIGMTIVRSWKQISKLAATLGGQSELWAAVSTKAIWWDLRLASLLMHLFSFPLLAYPG